MSMYAHAFHVPQMYLEQTSYTMDRSFGVTSNFLDQIDLLLSGVHAAQSLQRTPKQSMNTANAYTDFARDGYGNNCMP